LEELQTENGSPGTFLVLKRSGCRFEVAAASVVGLPTPFNAGWPQVPASEMSSEPKIEETVDRAPQDAGDLSGAFGAGPRPAELWGQRHRSFAWSKSAGLGLAAVCAVLLLAGVELFLAERMKELRDRANLTERQLASVEQRVGRLELQMEQLLSRRVPDNPPGASRPEGETAPVVKPDSSITLTRAEIDIVRDYIKLPPAAAGTVATMSVGAPVGSHVLVPFPSQIADRVPKLVGARFTTDRNGAIVVVAAGSDRIGFIIPPN